MEPDQPAYYELTGEPVGAGSLTLPKARALAQLLLSQQLPYVRLLACQRTPACELIILEVEPEVPQRPVYDIRAVERLGIGFTAADEEHPLVFALRQDFPYVPHVQLGPASQPRVLCLYQVSYAELKPTWTAAGLLRQAHRWLSQTARGELHAADQPLEPAFYAPREQLVVPAAFFAPDAVNVPGSLTVRQAGTTLGYTTWVATATTDQPAAGEAPTFTSFVYTAPPQVHGLIQAQPRTLGELAELLAGPSTDFVAALRRYLLTRKEEADFAAGHRLLLLVRLPQRRAAGAAVEKVEVWAFATRSDVATVGSDLGIWVPHGRELGQLLPPDASRTGQQTELDLLLPLPALTQSAAAAYNGLPATDTRFVAVGTGSLGSQVLAILVRAGQGNWVWLDQDQYLPHNVARHYLPPRLVGHGKAQALAATLAQTYEQASIRAITADVLRPAAAAETVAQACAEAEVLLDMSASVAVARHLSLDVASTARRVSLFLNPAGTDLVLLAEPADRTVRLDQLEMDYYRALLRADDDDELATHLLRAGQPVRYSYACRDVSAQLPQEQVALHAAIGARAVRTSVAQPPARLALWHARPDLSVASRELPTTRHTELRVGSWTVSVSHEVLRDMSRQRQERLPNETGGVLLGVFDTQRERVYVVDFIPSPPDSQEWPTAYYRGVAGVPERLAEVSARTGRQVLYAGEWHSHPDNCPTLPSADDRQVFAWLQAHRRFDGLPALMAIAGEHDTTSWYVGDLAAGGGTYRLPPD